MPNIDPVLMIDYRRLSLTDWDDFQHTPETHEMFEAFTEAGAGNHGITVASNISGNTYSSLSLTFDMGDSDWRKFKSSHVEAFRLQIAHISASYQEIFFNKPRHNYQITPREAECLFWVAMGKTDDMIAEILKIGKWTVVSHLKSAKFKLGCPNRAAAVATALSTGLINLRKAG